MTINGEPAATEATFGVRNPATGAVFAQAPECSRLQLDAAFDAAAKAGREWRSDEAARRAALLRASEILLAQAPTELSPTLTAEQGKPLGDAGIEGIA
jgi:acyl-CoA reductase-like NAD-dependent aldehyde dehydrogenase